MNLQKILRPLVLGLLFLIPIFPLIVANSMFFPFITGKAFFFRIVVELAFSGWIILAFLDAKYRPKFTPITAAVTLFAVVTLIADLIGVNPLRSIWSNFERMEGWLVIAHLWMFFMTIVHMFRSDAEGHRMWHRWLNFSIAVASVVAIYGFAQLFGLAAIHQGSSRIDASLGNAAYMAVYMVIHAFLAAYMFFAIRGKRIPQGVFPHYGYGVLALVFSFMVFQTSTRGTILALIGAVALSLFLYAIVGRKESTKHRSIALGIIGVMIVIGGIFWANRDAAFVKNNEVLNRLASISLNESKTQARGYIWPMALTGFQERPILGWGQENFNYIFNANYNPQMWGQEQWFDRAHNVYLDWLTASGALGLLVYLSLYVLAFMAIWRSVLTLREKCAFTGLIAAYAVHNVFVFDNLASYVLFFSVLGFLASLREGKHIKLFGTKPVRVDAVEYIVAPVVLVLLVGGMYLLNIRPIQANTSLIAALQACQSNPQVSLFADALAYNQYMANQEIREQLLGCSGNVIGSALPLTLKQEFLTFTSTQLEKQVAVTPNDTRVYVFAGSFYNAIGQPQIAGPFLEKAAELSPNKQSVELQLVNSYVNQGKIDESLAILKRLFEITPLHPGVREAYIKVLIVAGREVEARQMFSDSDIFESESVAQIYTGLKKYPQAIAIYEKLIAANLKDIQLRARFVQMLAQAEMKTRAIQELRKIIVEFPEVKAEAEALIKQIEG